MRLFSDKGKRTKWEAGLIWFRLRYLDPPTQAIKLLSRPEACGRVALYYRPGEPVSQLFIGIPHTYTRLLERMSADFGFSLSPKLSEVPIPPHQPMMAVSDLPWDRAFVAQIANEFAFVSFENGSGPYLPQPPTNKSGRGPATWHLPDDPPLGLTLKPAWPAFQPLPDQPVTVPEAGCWPLGWTAACAPLGVCGRINLYGRQEAAADWLVERIAQIVMLDPTYLVVIDGAGDLVPRLKRKSAVTRLLGKELIYIDLDGPALTGGFNPLAAVPGETGEGLVARWQEWFEGMNVHPESIQLLTQARQDGVGDIPALRKWLKEIGRQGYQTAVSSLSMALNRLTADPNLREWLMWPANQFENLPERVLFFSCKNLGWERQQLLRAVILAVLQIEEVRLVVHGVFWESLDFLNHPSLLLSNGPHLPGSTIVLTRCHPQGAAILANRFLDGRLDMQENLQLLHPGEGVVVMTDGPVLVSVNGKDGARLSRKLKD